jgi:hypothetical protein
MRVARRALLIAGILIVGVALTSGVAARVRESKVKSIAIGMRRTEVERLLGVGTPSVTAPACGRCTSTQAQVEYVANPSIWYGHLADKLIVCYVDDLVCDTLRIGL